MYASYHSKCPNYCPDFSVNPLSLFSLSFPDYNEPDSLLPESTIGVAMDTSSRKQRYEELKQQIHFHNYRYHVLDDPVISDIEFDRLVVELRRIEAAHPDWVTPDSPTQRAGAVVSDRFEKVRHPAPILSLANAFGAEDARLWYERVR